MVIWILPIQAGVNDVSKQPPHRTPSVMESGFSLNEFLGKGLHVGGVQGSNEAMTCVSSLDDFGVNFGNVHVFLY